jgi:hypothetical protein
MHPSSQFFWPWELQKHVPDIRVMLFGYDADISPQLGANLVRIKGLAENLLSSLVNSRQEDSVSNFLMGASLSILTVSTWQEAKRPLIFIGHSLGGLIIKKVCKRVTLLRIYLFKVQLLIIDSLGPRIILSSN